MTTDSKTFQQRQVIRVDCSCIRHMTQNYKVCMTWKTRRFQTTTKYIWYRFNDPDGVWAVVIIDNLLLSLSQPQRDWFLPLHLFGKIVLLIDSWNWTFPSQQFDWNYRQLTTIICSKFVNGYVVYSIIKHPLQCWGIYGSNIG